MNIAVRAVIGLVSASVPLGMTSAWVGDAKDRLESIEQGKSAEEAPAEVATAAAANEGYCTPQLKQVLRRVLLSCGLAADGQARGCQPVDAKSVAKMAGEDFNALFMPLSERVSIIQFDKNESELDPSDVKLLEETFADQRGASWFFAVARSSPEGSVEHNRELSQKRADAVLEHLRKRFNDPDLDKEVGLLWLGEEYAQLDQTFCDWRRSGNKDECEPEHINRSAFVAWIDCRL
jgi:outer membrane protein OmpA-like peptidoglycan-associated protein